jgi:hypothetical protein
LKELQKSKIKRIKFRQWLLLLIRVLIIIFLVLAFARPTIKGTVAGSGTTAAVFIFDDSYSMSLLTPQGSLFNIAKKVSKEIASSFAPEDRIAALTASSEGNKINFAPLSEALKQIDMMSVSSEAVKLNEILTQAANKLSKTTAVNKEIFVFSDFQKSAVDPKQFNADEKIKIYAIALQEKNVNNLSVDSFYTDNQIFELNKSITFIAAIKNHSNTQAVNRIASLYINGRRAAQQNFSIPSRERTIVSFETALIDTGIIDAKVVLEDDDILYDNERHLAFYAPGKIKVLMLFENKKDVFFLNAALTTSLNDKTQTVLLDETSYGSFAAVDLNKYDAIISVGAPDKSRYGIFSEYVRNGGNLILFPSSADNTESHKDFCEALGMRGVRFQNISNSVHYTGKINTDNPLIKDLFENKERPEIDSPEIYKYCRLNGFYEGDLIIAMDDGSPFLAEIKKGAGKIFLFNTAPVAEWSDFPFKSLFAPLINKLVRYSASANVEKEYRAGERIIIDLSGVASPVLKIIRPDNTAVYLNRNESPNRNIVSFTDTGLPGLYKFYADSKLIKFAAVNTDPAESELENYTEGELKNSAGFIPISALSFSREEITQLRYGSELWKYLIILVILLAAIETFLSKSNKREVIELEKGN